MVSEENKKYFEALRGCGRLELRTNVEYVNMRVETTEEYSTVADHLIEKFLSLTTKPSCWVRYDSQLKPINDVHIYCFDTNKDDTYINHYLYGIRKWSLDNILNES